MADTLAHKARFIDHLVLPVGDLGEARKRFSHPGFAVAPDAQHPFGTANVCTFLADDTYLEMLAVDRKPLYDKALRKNSFIRRDRAHRFRNGEDGFSAIAFKTGDARADHTEFKRQGLSGGSMVEFSRAFTMRDGRREKASFRLAFAADLRAPDAFFFTCQRLAYPVAGRSHLVAHRNGVTGLRGVLMYEAEPRDFSATLQGIFHSPVRESGDASLAIAAGNADIEALTPGRLEQRFGWQPELHGRGLRLAGLVFTAASLDDLEQLFIRDGIGFSKRDGRILVAPAPGQGALFVFEGSKS